MSCNEGRYNKIPLNGRIRLLCNQEVDKAYNFLLVYRALSHIGLNVHHSCGLQLYIPFC